MLMEGGSELIQREVGCAIHIKHGADAPVGFIELHNLRIATEGDIECMEFRFQLCRRGISGFQCGFKFLHNGLHLLDDAGVILNIADTELYTEKLHHLTCFALAEQHSGIEDPVLLYAVETSLQLHIAELTEPLRELYVVGYSLPTTSAYIYQSMAGRLQSIFGKYMPDLELKDFYEMEIASASIMRGFMAMPCDVYFTMEAKISRFLECSLKLYDVSQEQRKGVIAAVLQMDLRRMAEEIIQKTVAQAEEGFAALPALKK